VSGPLGDSIFGQHLFSRNLFGGSNEHLINEDKVRPVYFLYRVCGERGAAELRFLEESRLFTEDAEPHLEAVLREKYGPGRYQVMSAVDGGPQRYVKRIDVAAPQAVAAPSSVVPPLPLQSVVVETMPLHMLAPMLLGAAESDGTLAPGLARSIIGGWLSTLTITTERETFAHPWMPLMPMFDEHSDSQIYATFVTHGFLEDRAVLKEHILDGISMVRVCCERESAKSWLSQDQNRGTWYLWLDDERDPAVVLAADNGEAMLGARYQQYVDAGLLDVSWRWAKSAQQAMDFVEEFGHPKIMALDHDLGPGPNTMAFIRWMSDGGWHQPKWYVHSANPVGAENINAFMRSWEKYMKGEGPMTASAHEAAEAPPGEASEAAERTPAWYYANVIRAVPYTADPLGNDAIDESDDEADDPQAMFDNCAASVDELEAQEAREHLRHHGE